MIGGRHQSCHWGVVVDTLNCGLYKTRLSYEGLENDNKIPGKCNIHKAHMKYMYFFTLQVF